MKKTGDYAYWILMAFLIQAIFMILLKVKLQPIHLLNFVSFVGFFLIYRFLLDWNYWDNSIQKLLKKLVIRKDVLYQTVFVLIATVLLLSANKSFFVLEPVFVFIGFISVLVGSTLTELIRKLCLPKVQAKNYAYNFNRLKEGENEKCIQRLNKIC